MHDLRGWADAGLAVPFLLAAALTTLAAATVTGPPGAPSQSASQPSGPDLGRRRQSGHTVPKAVVG